MISRRPRATPILTHPQPEPEAPASPGPTASIDLRNVLGVNSLMLSSLPPMASGADVYVRQFYGNGSLLPARRYLPLQGL